MKTNAQHLAVRQRGEAQFQAIAIELGHCLDLHPEGITQERAWAHLKTQGQRASVDQIRTVLDRMTRADELIANKNSRNETVWKRSHKTVTAEHVHRIVAGDTPLPANAVPIDAAAADHPALAGVRKSMADMAEMDQIRHLTAPKIAATYAATIATPEAPTPTATPSPEPPAMGNPKTRQTRQRGADIAQGVLNALANGPLSFSAITKAVGASDGGVHGALQRLAAQGRIRRKGKGLRAPWELKGMPAGGGTPSEEVQAIADRIRSRHQAQQWHAPDVSEKAARHVLHDALANLKQRLQPVHLADEKLVLLDELIAAIPPPVNTVLRQIRDDFARLTSAA